MSLCYSCTTQMGTLSTSMSMGMSWQSELSCGAFFSKPPSGVATRHPLSLTKRRRRRRRGVVSSMPSIEMCDPEDFQVDRLLGSYGYMNVTSYSTPRQGGMLSSDKSPLGYDLRDVERLSGQEVGEGAVTTRLYSGRFARGRRMGTRVIFKAYPGRTTGGIDADAMAANELKTHAILQDCTDDDMCPNLAVLMGGFQTRTGEQWLVFRDDGIITASDYATEASEATAEGRAVGEWDFWDRFDLSRPINRRRVFVIKMLRGIFSALVFMHSKGRLHQSLGPASVIINTIQESDPIYLQPRIRDLAFSVDVSDQTIFGGFTVGIPSRRRLGGLSAEDMSMEEATSRLSEGLWRRAASAGAITPLEQKAFGISDDIYAAGLLFAYLTFVPFCQPGSIDGPSIQRLFETTFQLDIQAARDYCMADERWTEAVTFLDLGEGAGWELLQAMLNPDYRQRPIAEAVLNHRFMTGAIL